MQYTVGGHQVYAYTGGKPFDPRLPVLVFLHGAQQDHSCWQLPSRYFAHHGRAVLAVDLPGHGRSALPPLSSIAAIADWSAALLDAAGVDKATLVGHSMGSLAALEAAARHPQRVDAIALLGCAVPMPVSAALLEAARHDEAQAMEMINVWSHSPGALLGGNAAPGLWMFGLNRRLMERAAAGVLANDLAACNDYRDGLESAAEVACPVLLVSGSRDQMTPPRAARALAGALKNVRSVTIEGCGHALMAEQPDRVLDSLRGFIMDG